MGQFQYGVVRMNEEFFEDVVVEHLVDELGYEQKSKIAFSDVVFSL